MNGALTPLIYRLGGYHEYPPPPDLACYAELVWWYARPIGAPGIPGQGHRVLPETGISLCHECRRTDRGVVMDGRLVVVGPVRTTRFFDPQPGLHMEAVRLSPEWAVTLLGVRPFNHTDAIHGFGESVGRARVTRLEQRLARTTSSAEAVRVLVDWLRERAAETSGRGRSRWVDLAHAGLERVRGARTTTIRPDRIAAALGVSERHFRRVVRELTGQSPKHHHRVRRLGRTVAAADSAAASPAWARLAVASGYYDQPHLIQEFRTLVGLTPGQTHRERRLQRTTP